MRKIGENPVLASVDFEVRTRMLIGRGEGVYSFHGAGGRGGGKIAVLFGVLEVLLLFGEDGGGIVVGC